MREQEDLVRGRIEESKEGRGGVGFRQSLGPGQAGRKWPTEEQLQVTRDGAAGTAGSRPWSVPSLPTAGRRRPGGPKADKLCACAVRQTRSPEAAAGSLTFRSHCIFPSGVTPIFRVSLTGLSTPPFWRLFGLPIFFFLSSPPPQPSTPARAWPYRLSPLRRPAGPGPPARAGPRGAAGCSYLGRLGRQLGPGSVLAGGAAGPCSALRRGRRKKNTCSPSVNKSMFPNSILGRPPFTPNHQQHNNFFALSPTLYSHQQLIDAQYNFQNVDLSRAVALQPLAYGTVSPIQTSTSPLFRGRKRISDEKNFPLDGKRQRFHSPHQEPTIINQIVPLSGDRRYSMPPLFHTHYVPDIVRCVPPLREIPLLEPREITLPEAKDKLSQQILELFETCQQQMSDLKKKELCRAQLQREIQLLFPQSRLFLVGSSLNGFGARSSDGDLCLVVKEEPCFFQVNQKTEARHILTLVYKHFCTRLSGYIERPQLIRAKVPIVKFRDKVSCVEFDLNVNNTVGIRNTFLLRTYAYLENRVRPLVLVIKKWASHHEINDASRGTLSSYSLVLMVLHYLQTLPEPILPSLQKIYPESFSTSVQLHLVHHAPCNVPPYLSKNESSLGDLLLGFLKYYATEFDWNTQMISVREAKAIPRPDDIEWRNKYICVEEPFDGTNTARAVHEKQKFDMIKDQFLKSWHRLKSKRDLNSVLPLRAATLKR